MYVRMLTAMAGEDTYNHGQIVDLEDRIAKAWVEAGIAEIPPRAAASEKAAKDLQARVVELQAALVEAAADNEALRVQIVVLVEQNAALIATAAAAANAA